MKLTTGQNCIAQEGDGVILLHSTVRLIYEELVTLEELYTNPYKQ